MKSQILLILSIIASTFSRPTPEKRFDLLAETHCDQWKPNHPGFLKACVRDALDTTKGVYLNLVRTTPLPNGELFTETLDRPGHGDIYLSTASSTSVTIEIETNAE